jgi:hypothetical protein
MLSMLHNVCWRVTERERATYFRRKQTQVSFIFRSNGQQGVFSRKGCIVLLMPKGKLAYLAA